MSVLFRLLPLLVLGCLLQLRLTTARNDCKSAQKREANARLTEDFSSCPKYHLEDHLPFKYDDGHAVTNPSSLKTLCQDRYVIRYSTERKTPLFTAERLYSALLNTRTPVRRSTCFRPDPRLNGAESSVYIEYKRSVYSFGHMVPAGDMMTNSVHKLNTFILSNMVPQYPIHNNYPWNDWEEYVRQRAREERSLYVITGVAGVLENVPNKFTVPKYLYKLLVWCDNGAIQAEYIYTLHRNIALPQTWWGTTSTQPLSQDVLSIGVVQANLESRTTGRTVAQVEEFIGNQASITFKIGASRVCSSSLPNIRELTQLPSYIRGKEEESKKGQS